MTMLCMVMFLMGLLVYSFYYKHMLCMLLSLEYIVLSLFSLLFYTMNLYNMDLYFSLVYMIMSVCEGALGLSIMVLMVRMYGNDYLSSLNILMC
uniref:NADH-ubiquinone oxidoreductase chain 4L n=1 Tax=Coniopteryx sp. YW-2016 TaxID=1821761 RepID=A0A1S5QYD0_9NEOP|nr:NADH dehydrogenase subunit 4L [Coniopteryx sp. YW-2016]